MFERSWCFKFVICAGLRLLRARHPDDLPPTVRLRALGKRRDFVICYKMYSKIKRGFVYRTVCDCMGSNWDNVSALTLTYEGSDPDPVWLAGLLQSTQLHMLLQGTAPSKHSQYFFRHLERRHLQPILCAVTGRTSLWFAKDGLYLESKAAGLRSSIV